jgi:hypothetical protein
MIVYLQHLFTPSYLTILYAFLGGAAYGVTGSKYGFFKVAIRVTITCIICSVGYVAYALGVFK